MFLLKDCLVAAFFKSRGREFHNLTPSNVRKSFLKFVEID